MCVGGGGGDVVCCRCSLLQPRHATAAPAWLSPLPPLPCPLPNAQIEEARRREQADKMAAIHALEAQSQEIMRHKQAMAALQTRIQSMQSQLLVGGQKVEDTPQFRCVRVCARASVRACREGDWGGAFVGKQPFALCLHRLIPFPVLLCRRRRHHRRTLLAAEQARIRQQYEARLRDLESERQSVQEDKAQVRARA